jgi:ribulose-5-phosphate 4-epimerase/fuculose-1-phosphate aldolase
MSNPTETEYLIFLRQEICRIGRSLFERGYVHGSTGNISVRVPQADGGGFLITPTDACLGFLDPSRLSRIDAQGEQVSGDRASKTLVLHRRIYDCDSEAGCVVHTHSSWLVDLTLRGVWSKDDIVPPITPYYVMKVGHVPLIDYCRPGAPAVADAIERLVASHRARGLSLRAVMCDKLGPQVWGPTPGAAMATLEELEETAKLWLRGGCTAKALDETSIQELRELFKASW